ncbi:MAG: hypothetical protein JXQ67_07565 [Campylobacterales bacterium]|nr:hypothetical protein [Campylobacterales bacterium]
MFRIIYIDEYQDDIDDFLDYIEDKDSEGIFKVIPLFPMSSLDETIEKIFENKPDAIVSDYKLNEYKTDIEYNVPYNGVGLLEKVLETKKDFPCFVMTSYDDEAIKSSQDVNVVYIKDILHGSEDNTSAKANFVDIIQNQIIHYKKRIKDAESELDTLISKSELEPLDSFEEERILDLERLIEESTDRKCKIPKQLKELPNLNKIHKMIDNTDELIKELKKES